MAARSDITTEGCYWAAGKALFYLNVWWALEVLMGPLFGETLLRDPVLEVWERQFLWLQLVYNVNYKVNH